MGSHRSLALISIVLGLYLNKRRSEGLDHMIIEGIADHDTRHETVNHSADEWVRGDVHTNYIENIWSLLKRSLVGSYHKVSKKHLEAYLDELEWRFNNRDNPYLFRDTLLKLIKSDNLEYKELITSA